LQALVVSMLSAHDGEPQTVVFAGYLHAPVSSQPVAPQVASPVTHTALQHLPLPLMPQVIDAHDSFEVQAAPSSSQHAPSRHEKPLMQLAELLQLVRHAVPASLHARCCGHDEKIPPWQAPVSSQVPVACRVEPKQFTLPQVAPIG
jgi:hypothetical protein